MKTLLGFAILSILATSIVCLVPSQCFPKNDGSATKLTTALANPTSVITFDDLGLLVKAGTQMEAFPFAVLSTPKQNITLEGSSCRLYYGNTDRWSSTDNWNGETAKPGYFMIAGYDGYGYCTLHFDPPINSFSGRFNGRTAAITIFDSNNDVIECMPVESFLNGKNAYQILGFSSLVPIASFSISSHSSTACVFADVLQFFDECPSEGTNCGNMCSTNGACTQRPGGSYACSCNEGYYGNGIVCSDINECATTNLCSVNAACTNTPGSYYCTCLPGYSGDGYTCVDINECATNPCDTNAGCTNIPGSFSCNCNSGYFGDGFNCSDIDECATGKPCNPNAACTNNDGSYTCTCNSGYSGDGISCTDINECTTNNPCDPNAICTNNGGSFTCTCISGYTGNGVTCTDVDECTVNNPCDPNASCSNNNGSFECACNDGFTGDGTSCQAEPQGTVQSTKSGNGSVIPVVHMALLALVVLVQFM